MLDRQGVIIPPLDPKVLKELYLNYRTPLIRWLIKSYSLEIEEATELAQSAFVIFVEKSANGSLPSFQSETNTKSYLFAIAKNKAREWKRQIRKTTPLNESHSEITDSLHLDLEDIKNEKIQIATIAFKRLGEKCQQLLQLAIVFKLSMQEIADQLKYENTNTAKNLKYKCLQRLRKLYTQSKSNP